MKLIVAVLALFVLSLPANSQSDSVRKKPYERFPGNVPLQLLLLDSSTIFTRDNLEKKKAVMLMLFSPDCEHCQHETEGIIQHIDRFKDIQIIMATTLPFAMMKDFNAKYDLGRFKNIVVGSDKRFLLPVYYDVRNLPFLAFYNKKKELIGVFEGALPVDKVLEKFQ